MPSGCPRIMTFAYDTHASTAKDDLPAIVGFPAQHLVSSETNRRFQITRRPNFPNLFDSIIISFRCAGEAKDARPATTDRRGYPVPDCSGALRSTLRSWLTGRRAVGMLVQCGKMDFSAAQRLPSLRRSFCRTIP